MNYLRYQLKIDNTITKVFNNKQDAIVEAKKHTGGTIIVIDLLRKYKDSYLGNRVLYYKFY